MRPFAVFDIDGTIIRWQLYHALADALVKRGQIDKTSFEEVKKARMSWKNRDDEDSFVAYEMSLVKVFTYSLVGMPSSDLMEAADEVFEVYKDQVYTYTRGLIQDLKQQNYLLFAISGSPSILVSKLAEYYGFDGFRASEYKHKEGIYTGEVELSIGRKPELLQELKAEFHASTEGSFGVGDSEGDISMLEAVASPIAFNPSNKLKQHAEQKGWNIVIERKNVVYQLNSSDGSYILG